MYEHIILLEMFPDEDDDKKTRKERDEERARKRVLTSSLLHDLRGDMITISQFVVITFVENFYLATQTINYHILWPKNCFSGDACKICFEFSILLCTVRIV